MQYASINGNGFGGYGETVFGTEGTLVLETEREAMLFKGSDTAGKTKVVAAAAGKKSRAALRIEKDGDPESAAIGLLGSVARRTRLRRGTGTLGLVHPQPCAGEPAPLPSEGRVGRRGHRTGHQHGRPKRPTGRIPKRMVRR